MGIKKQAQPTPAPTLVKSVKVWKQLVAELGTGPAFADRIIQELFGYDWDAPMREVDRDQLVNVLLAVLQAPGDP